jgi:hypothetical protein
MSKHATIHVLVGVVILKAMCHAARPPQSSLNENEIMKILIDTNIFGLFGQIPDCPELSSVSTDY